jgi:hypothetical protein
MVSISPPSGSGFCGDRFFDRSQPLHPARPGQAPSAVALPRGRAARPPGATPAPLLLQRPRVPSATASPRAPRRGSRDDGVDDASDIESDSDQPGAAPLGSPQAHAAVYSKFGHLDFQGLKLAVAAGWPQWAAGRYRLVARGAEVADAPTPGEAAGILRTVALIGLGSSAQFRLATYPNDALVVGAAEALGLCPPRDAPEGGLPARALPPDAVHCAIYSLALIGGDVFFREELEVLCDLLPTAFFPKMIQASARRFPAARPPAAGAGARPPALNAADACAAACVLLAGASRAGGPQPLPPLDLPSGFAGAARRGAGGGGGQPEASAAPPLAVRAGAGLARAHPGGGVCRLRRAAGGRGVDPRGGVPAGVEPGAHQPARLARAGGAPARIRGGCGTHPAGAALL